MDDGALRAAALGVAALNYLIEELGDEPIEASLELRALLAFLYHNIGGERRHYDDFWKTVTDPLTGQTQRHYVRRTWARSHWYGINRAAEADPRFSAAYVTVIRCHQLKTDPEAVARVALAKKVRLADLMRDLVGHKGVPRSAAEARLANYMRRNGGSAQGFDPFAF